MPILRQQLRQSPLAFPGRLSGFDPSHVAGGAAVRFSGIAAGANFINLLNGGIGAPVSQSKQIDGVIGQVATSNISAGQINFAGQSTVNDTSFTMAAIVFFNAVSALQVIFASSSVSNKGMFLGVSAAAAFEAGYLGGSTISSGITIVAQKPYFLVGSFNGTAASSWAVTRLDTGTITTATSTASSPVGAPNGTYTVNGWNGGFAVTVGRLAAVMFSGSYVPAPALLQWAADPWAFWYPRSNYGAIDIGMAPAIVPSGAKFRRSLSLIGGRVGSRQAA